MQEVVDRKSLSAIKTAKADKPSAISAAKMSILTVPIKNAPGSPLVVHAFSAKARATMRESQEKGSAGKNKRHREPKDFEAVYNNARHISREGWDGVAAATFRNAMIDACRLVGFKMTVGKLTVFIEPDGVSQADGMPLVRIFGEPVPFESVARNQTGVADIRVRPRWDEWTANVRIRFDSEQFNEMDVVNLLARRRPMRNLRGATQFIGIVRPGLGLFEIDQSKGISVMEVPAPKIEFRRG